MLDKLHEETCLLKMRLIALGLALPPPACTDLNKLKQIHKDYYEMASALGYNGPKKLMLTSHYVFLNVLGRHFRLQHIQDLSSASKAARNYMAHYFTKSFNVR